MRFCRLYFNQETTLLVYISLNLIDLDPPWLCHAQVSPLNICAALMGPGLWAGDWVIFVIPHIIRTLLIHTSIFKTQEKIFWDDDKFLGCLGLVPSRPSGMTWSVNKFLYFSGCFQQIGTNYIFPPKKYYLLSGPRCFDLGPRHVESSTYPFVKDIIWHKY